MNTSHVIGMHFSCSRQVKPLAGCLLVFSLFVSGCTTTLSQWKARGYKVGPNYCRPEASLEMEWIDMQSDPELSVNNPDVAAWWYSLNDPTLNELIEFSRSENLTLKQACTRVRQAQATRGIAYGNLFPQIQQAVGDYQRIRTSKNVAIPSPIREFDQYNLGLSAAWEVDFWGRFRRSFDAADAALDASIAGYDEVAVVLYASVASTYVQIRTIQERLKLTRRNIENQQGALHLAEARFRARQTNKLDVNQAKNNIHNTEAAIPALEAQLRIANNQLCVLLGIPPQDLVSELPPGSIPEVSQQIQIGIPTDLLRRRPDIRRAERLMKLQSERIGIAETDLYPRIALLGSFEWQAEGITDVFDASSLFALVGPTFSWNIWNYGRIRNNIEWERAKFSERIYQYQQTVLTAQLEVEDGIIGFRKAKEKSIQLALAVEQVDEANGIVTSLYRTGATDYNRVFLIQSVQFAQQDQLAISRANEALNLIKIYQALGGGWQSRCAEFAVTSLPIEEPSASDGNEKEEPPTDNDTQIDSLDSLK